jgi:hypothetical protein
MHLVLLTHIVRSSIILMVLLEPLWILLTVLHRWHIRRVLRSNHSSATLNIVDAEAREIGDDLPIAAYPPSKARAEGATHTPGLLTTILWAEHARLFPFLLT